jgi:signal transduction histidine kinase
MSTPTLFRSGRWSLQVVCVYVLAWTLLGLFFATREIVRRAYRDEPLMWQNLLTTWLVGACIWAMVALLVLYFAQRWPLERATLGRRIAIHLPLSVGIAAIQLAFEAAAYLRLGILPRSVSGSFWDAWGVILSLGLHGNIVTYWVILGIATGWRHYRSLRDQEQQAMLLEIKAAELQTQLANARLSALKMQLHPHFLFNTLNTIMVLVRQQSFERAEAMLGRLADLLRCVLDESNAQEVTLRRELDYVRLYLEIEQARFEDRLRVDIDVAPGVLDAAVPHMALQPIVENAVRHGIARSSEVGRIRISAAARDGKVRIDVRNDGPGLCKAETPAGFGIGVANTRSRLEQLYGEGAGLSMEDDDHGVTVTLVLPFRAVSDSASLESPCASRR